MLAARKHIQMARIRRKPGRFGQRRKRSPRTAAIQQRAAEPEQQGWRLVLRERVPAGAHDGTNIVGMQEVPDVLVFEVFVSGVVGAGVGKLAAGFDRVVVI